MSSEHDSSLGGLTHLDASGRVRMVDVSRKAPTFRRAVASALVNVGQQVYSLLSGPGLPKGDVLAVAKIAGIQAAKRTSELIPLCHGLAPEFVDVQISLRPPHDVLILAEARVESKTGVEIDALMAASIAAITVYDMCKSVSKEITIGPIQLEEKSGGKSGEWRRTD
ncbi:MAG: cyclic pyranopterin monophosphate synthase MoaC [Phycisphaerae bacterium]